MKIILLPGLDGTGVLFRPLVAALPGQFEPVVVGYPVDRRLTYHELLPYVLAALPSNQPFLLLGESFSGPLAIMAAATQPTGLRGVILCATFATAPIPWLKWIAPLLANSLVFQSFPLAQRCKAMLLGYSNPQLRGLFAEAHAKVRPGIIAQRVRQTFAIDVRDQLASCLVPMLYIAAEKDRVVPASNLRLIQRLVPQMTVVKIAGPHGILQSRPLEAVSAMTGFAASLEPSEDCAST